MNDVDTQNYLASRSYAQDAAKSAEEARLHAVDAFNNAGDARDSAGLARQHADTSATNLQRTEQYKTSAENSATSAASSVLQATQSANAAKVSENVSTHQAGLSANSATKAKSSEDKAKVSETNALKSEQSAWRAVDSIGEVIVNGGGWDASTGAYPAKTAKTTQWIAISDGTVDGHKVEGGDFLYYFPKSDYYYIVSRKDAVGSVNGQTGIVVLSPKDIGAVSKTGDTMTGQLNANGGIKIINSVPALTLVESDHENKEWAVEVNSKNLDLTERGVVSRLRFTPSTDGTGETGQALFYCQARQMKPQGTTNESLTRKDYVDGNFQKVSQPIGNTSTETDLNTFRTVGRYNSLSPHNKFLNLPTGVTEGAFVLIVESINPYTSEATGYVRQTLKPYNSTKTFVRCDGSGSANNWSSWAMVYDSLNKPTAADVGALPRQDASNWGGTLAENAVVGQLGWTGYGNNHVIFDASRGIAPNGAAISKTESTHRWSATYPTLMGWNGSNTFGVKVDRSRQADLIQREGSGVYIDTLGNNGENARITTPHGSADLGCSNSSWFHMNTTASDGFYMYQPLNAHALTSRNDIYATGNMSAHEVYARSWLRTTGDHGWFNETYGGGIYMADPTWVRVYNGKQFHVANTSAEAIRTEGGIWAKETVTAKNFSGNGSGISNIGSALSTGKTRIFHTTANNQNSAIAVKLQDVAGKMITIMFCANNYSSSSTAYVPTIDEIKSVNQPVYFIPCYSNGYLEFPSVSDASNGLPRNGSVRAIWVHN